MPGDQIPHSVLPLTESGQLNTMSYLVVIKRTFDESEYGSDYTFEDAYFQGSEKEFNTEEEATAYFKSFEDWEQDLLTIDYLPF